MDLYGRPAPRRTLTPAVAFLNERAKSLSFSSGFKPPGVSKSHGEDEAPHILRPDHPSSNQQQQESQQPPPLLHQRPASSRFLNRPQSSCGVRRQQSFAVSQETKQRPSTAREGVRTLPTTQSFGKRPTCFSQDIEGPKGSESDSQGAAKEPTDTSPSLDEQYVQQLKADILHLHHVHRQLEDEADTSEKNADRLAKSAAPQAPNHVKNLLLHRDTKAYLGWSSQRSMDVKAESGASISTAIIQTQLLRYNYSSDPAQLAAAKVGLESLLADTLISLMEFCLTHEASEGTDSSFKVKLVRPPSRQHGEVLLPFANGCGTSSASIYAGGILSVLQQTEILKRTMLASTGEKKLLVKVIADQDSQLRQLTEQIGFFKDVLAQRRPHFEKSKRVYIPAEERDGGNTPESMETRGSEDTDQSKSNAAAEQLARLAALERDRVESILSIQSLEQQKGELASQLEQAGFELQAAVERFESAEQLHRQSLDGVSKSFQEQAESLEKRAADLQSSLTSTVERYRTLELSAAQEKAQLRRDKQELERLLRSKEDEAAQRQAQATAKADARAQFATAQLKVVSKQLNQAQQAVDALRVELKAAQMDNKQTQGTLRSLHHDLKVRNEDVESLTLRLAAASAAADSKTALVQQSEARIEAGSKEMERQQALLDEQAQQMQALEAKLSRSVPVDDEELQSRQQREESAWHQRVSALEHALVAERQNAALSRDQQRKAVLMEQEKAVHAVEQAQAVAAELATANLCLLERKRQREQEQKAFEEKLKEAADRTAEATLNKDALERELDSLRCQYEQLEQMKAQSTEEAAAAVKVAHDELAAVKEELKTLTEIRENLDRALAHALASPRGKSVRHQATLSELRAELQKAKQKVSALEEQLSRNGSVRTTEIDGKLAHLSARERRAAEEQRVLKKQRAEATSERRQLDQERRSLETLTAKQEADHQVLQNIIVLLAQRLRVMMALFDTVSVQDTAQQQGASNCTSTSNTSTATPDDKESWREMQHQWEALRRELEDVDWRLEDMRSQLEALHLEYVGQTMATLELPGQSSARSLPSGFHGPNPFSDAVAAGRDTVPVADQLKASRLLRRLSCPGESLESRARQVKAEEHETFALALAREMAAMKDGYERQLEDLRAELQKTQQRRLLASQRLRTELASERSRGQRAVAELQQRVAELEKALVAHEKTLATVQSEQQEILDQYAAAASDKERQHALRRLAELVGGEARRRERERLTKLLAYCGASSVTVERRDRALEQETVEAVLQIVHVEVSPR